MWAGSSEVCSPPALKPSPSPALLTVTLHPHPPTMAFLLQHVAQTAWEVVGEPALTAAGLYAAPDRAYGRLAIPFSPMEQRLHSNADVDVSFGKVMLSNGKDWVWYQVWQSSDASRPRRGDVLFVHGTGVHSGTLASHSRRYLDAGFRLIVPDLVSHGYSSGLHVYQDEMSGYTAGLHAVLHDVARRDDQVAGGRRRNKWERLPTFLLGLSFGGTVALHYALDYPDSLRQEAQGEWEVAIDGVVVVGPILGYSPDNVSVPPALATAIRFAHQRLALGRLELVVPHKKSLDKDPRVYKSLINEDKRSHQGAFRLGHLYCIDTGIVRIHTAASAFRHPVFLQQGGQDRVACHTRSVAWIRRIASTDKRMAIYPVCQHVVYRKAKSEEEDLAGRVACIEDCVDWMVARLADATPLASKLTSLDNISFYFGTPSIHSIPASQRTDSWNSSSTASDGLFDSSGEQSPEMTEVTPSRSPIQQAKELPPVGAGVGPFEECSTVIADHPLLAKAHKSTLPTLARLAPLRAYRMTWTLSEQLRPYDITVAASPAGHAEELITSGFSSSTPATKRSSSPPVPLLSSLLLAAVRAAVAVTQK